MLKSIKNGIKSLFSAGKIAETGVEMLDSAFFTDQERSKFMLEYLKATTPMALTRRIIACCIAVIWSLFVLIAALLFFHSSESYEAWSGFMADNVNTPFSVIMAFYFLAHVVKR